MRKLALLALLLPLLTLAGCPEFGSLGGLYFGIVTGTAEPTTDKRPDLALPVNDDMASNGDPE